MARVLSLFGQGEYSKRARVINTYFSAVWLLACLGGEMGTTFVPLQPGCFPPLVWSPFLPNICCTKALGLLQQEAIDT